jgi:hypothetical protein
MATLKGKHAGGDSKKELKERIVDLQKHIRKLEAEIVRLANRVIYVETINNETHALNNLLTEKHFIRAMIVKIFKR